MTIVDGSDAPQVAVFAGGGLVAGLVLLVRGFSGYRMAIRISDTSTSRIASIAAGEVRVTGIVEPAEVLLVSSLQSVPCVYFRAAIRESRADDGDDAVLAEEHAVGFRIRDESGELRIFPRRARWDVPLRFDDRSSALDGEPAGLRPRTGSLHTLADPDRETQVAQLLGLDRASGGAPFTSGLGGTLPGVGLFHGTGSRQRRYSEARVEPGDTITVIGRALPFGDLSDPTEADLDDGEVLGADDPEVAASIAHARAAGTLLDDPDEAWGNAAIPGFGIGRPTRAPELDPAARPLDLAAASEAERFERTFDIAPEQLVLASAADARLLVAFGTPEAAAGRNETTFLIGLLGAVLAIGSAIALAFVVAAGIQA